VCPRQRADGWWCDTYMWLHSIVALQDSGPEGVQGHHVEGDVDEALVGICAREHGVHAAGLHRRHRSHEVAGHETG